MSWPEAAVYIVMFVSMMAFFGFVVYMISKIK